MAKQQPNVGIDFDNITTVKLDNNVVDGLGRWSGGLKKALGITRLPFEEGAVLLSIAETGVGKTCHIYFKDHEDQRVKCEIYFDKKFHTQWYLNYQGSYFNTAGMTIESIPDSPVDFNLIRQMSSIMSHALVYFAMYHEDPNLVQSIDNKLITLRVPTKAPTAPGDIKTVKPEPEYKAIALDPNKPIGKQASAHLSAYYRDWVNDSIPALKGKTPVEASKTQEGRKELHDLFEYMRKMPSPIPFPVDEVKRALGL
jgi:hypothetical protein